VIPKIIAATILGLTVTSQPGNRDITASITLTATVAPIERITIDSYDLPNGDLVVAYEVLRTGPWALHKKETVLIASKHKPSAIIVSCNGLETASESNTVAEDRRIVAKWEKVAR